MQRMMLGNYEGVVGLCPKYIVLAVVVMMLIHLVRITLHRLENPSVATPK